MEPAPDMLARIEALEKEVVRWRELFSSTEHDFVLRTPDGAARVQLNFVDGGVHIDLCDRNETPKITLTIGETVGTRFVLCDDQGFGRIGLIVSPKGEASITLQDASLFRRAEMVVAQDGRPHIGLFAQEGGELLKSPPEAE